MSPFWSREFRFRINIFAQYSVKKISRHAIFYHHLIFFVLKHCSLKIILEYLIVNLWQCRMIWRQLLGLGGKFFVRKESVFLSLKREILIWVIVILLLKKVFTHYECAILILLMLIVIIIEAIHDQGIERLWMIYDFVYEVNIWWANSKATFKTIVWTLLILDERQL